MAGAAKQRVNKEAYHRTDGPSGSIGAGSLSGTTSASSSSHATRSARSEASSRTSPLRGPRNAGYDGNADPGAPSERNPATSKVIVDPKTFNFDLGMGGWSTVRGHEISSSMPPRPGTSKLGVPCKIGLNTYHVEQFPTISIFQFDVMIGNGVEKRGIVNKVWNSKAVQAAVGAGAIFDGNKLAWSGKPIEREVRLTINLDTEQGRTPRPGKPADTYRIAIRQTNKVGFAQLMAHLQGKASFDNTCLEAINFADHLLRQTPSSKYSQIKRSFFAHGERRFDLGGGIEAFKGVYQSLRIVHPGRLSVNIDVANGTFWTALPFVLSAVQVCGARDMSDLASQLSQKGEKSKYGLNLKKMRKVRVLAKHRNKAGPPDEYCIEKFVYTSAKAYTFETQNPAGQTVKTSLSHYFYNKYEIALKYPDLPLVKMTRGANTLLPMEVLMIKENQRYNFKCDEKQTSNMIKFAVTAPPERYQAIEHGLKMLSWGSDPVLNKYGIKINTTKTTVEGRVLVAPTVKFGAGEAKPGISGRWDLKGKKFFTVNPVPLKSWAVCVISGRRGGKPDKSTVENFTQKFVQGYIAHGGKVENKQPAMSLAMGDDVGAWVTATWNAAGNQSQSRPQILFFILPDKDSQVYGRIKRSCECRYGVVSQCIQYSHAVKAAPQYISNVCMKFNAKLGGSTCRASGPKTSGVTGIFTVPTVIVGADVSHAAPGSQAPSMAAMTVSMDKLAIRYAALCQTNGFRVEMINTDTINNELKPLLQMWSSNVGGGKLPQRLIYIRDGVSEAQYSHVLQQEVGDMKQLLKTADPSNKTQFIVIVGSKRHHVRFFPEKGDRNGNPLPGTLVETGVTNPFENDFYLCSHAAIKGTARPTHYYVLANEPKITNEELQTLLYEHVYQYARASTPVSLHPAIYYAHLAAARATPHDPKWAGSSDGPSGSTQKQQSGSQSGLSQGKSGSKGSSSGIPEEFDKLMPMPNQGGITTSMWYI